MTPVAESGSIVRRLCPAEQNVGWPRQCRDICWMSDLIGLSGLKYKSDAIVERRHRILRETRALIAETGYENFNVRDLCARAGVAPKTLYNAFGNKDNVIAAAIQEHLLETHAIAQYQFTEDTLDGRLERSLRVYAENLRVAPYTRAINAVFYGGSEFVRRSIRATVSVWHAPFLRTLEEANGIAVGVSTEQFSRMIVSGSFAVTSDWAIGEIPDAEYVDRAAETLLTVIVGCTRGKPNILARRWLEDLREQRASWISFRSVATQSAGASAVDPAPTETRKSKGGSSAGRNPVEKPKRRLRSA